MSDTLFDIMMRHGPQVRQGEVWTYARMTSQLGSTAQRHTALLSKVRKWLEKQHVYFQTDRGIGWRRCTARDMLIQDSKEFGGIVRRADRQMKRLASINPIALDDLAERKMVMERIGVWYAVHKEAKHQADVFSKRAKRMRKPKSEQSSRQAPVIALSHQAAA